MHELIVDNFAGGGGASTGIEIALGRPVDIAINHDPEAIAMHAANHPGTQHHCESVWKVKPRDLCDGQPVGLMWLSPDCKHFSKAKGGKPRDKNIRGLAWVALRWAATVRPRIIMLENVEEFITWGPVDGEGNPIKKLSGHTFGSYVRALESHGYKVEWRELRACDYGAPTIRKRLFLIARCDGQRIAWPEPTHGTGREPYRTAAECIDWSIPCPSIFDRRQPLAEATCRRIAKGIMRYVVNAPAPFIAPVIGGQPAGHGENVAAFLTKHYGGVVGQAVNQPVGTVTSIDHHSLVASTIVKMRGQNVGQPVYEPLHTISAGGTHHAEVLAFMVKYYGTDQDPKMLEPLHTITSKDRFGLVTVNIHGESYAIVDIGLRMLSPRELFRAQGFPESYIIEHGAGPEGQRINLTKSAQVRMVGNSVSPPPAAALVRENFQIASALAEKADAA
ncbi:MAG TPA: DNA cytosine methyltransferase [Rhodospirillaceae bacterium]|nr:DNA cytosine methyltransferase [Rhodospirillaceae bacterium]